MNVEILLRVRRYRRLRRGEHIMALRQHNEMARAGPRAGLYTRSFRAGVAFVWSVWISMPIDRVCGPSKACVGAPRSSLPAQVR